MTRRASRLERAAFAVALATVAWGPLAQGSAFGWGQSGLSLLGALTVALTGLVVARRGAARVPNAPWACAALALLVWIWASVHWAADHAEARRWAASWTAALGAALALHVLVDTPRRARLVANTALLTGAVAVGFAALQAARLAPPVYEALPGTPDEHLTGPYFHPSHFSGYLVAIAALASSALLFRRPSWRTPLVAALALAVQAVNWRTDGSSLPAVMLAAFTPAVVWAWRRRRAVGAALALLALAAGLGGAWAFASPAGRAFFEAHRADAGLRSQSLAGFLATRRAIHFFAERLWAAHPLGGVGVGQFPTEFQAYRRPGPSVPGGVDNELVNYAHGDAHQMLAETGAAGLGLFVVLLAASVAGPARGLGGFAWRAALPVYVLTAWYDSHLSAIPGTMVTAFALSALGAWPGRAPSPPGPADALDEDA